MSAHAFAMDKLAHPRQTPDGALRWEAGEALRPAGLARGLERFAMACTLAALVGVATYVTTADRSAGTTVAARIVVERRDASAGVGDDAFLSAQAKLLSSRDLLRRAAGELGFDGAVISNRPSMAERVLLAIGIGGADKLTSPEERLTEALADRFEATPSGAGRAIDIRFRADDGDMAARFVNKVVADYVALQRSGGGVEARLQADAAPVVRTSVLPPMTWALIAGLVAFVGGFVPSAVGWWRRRRRAAELAAETPVLVDPMEQQAVQPVDLGLVATRDEPAYEDAMVAGDGCPALVDFGGRKRLAIATLGEGANTHRLVEELVREGGFEGARLVVVDAGRRTSEHLGLSDLLAGEAGFADVIQRSGASRAHEIGAGRRSLAALSDDVEAMSMLIEALEQTYDLVLIDLGPLRADPAFTLLARLAGLLVVAGDADRGAVDTLMAALNRRGVTGIVRVPLFEGDVAAVA